MNVNLLEQAFLCEDLSIVDELLQDETLHDEQKLQSEWNLDELTIRKMLIKSKLLHLDLEKKKQMKQTIVSEWDRMIESVQKQISSIESLVQDYLRHDHQGKSLQLDVATVSLRNVKDNIQVKDKQLFENFLMRLEAKNEYLKQPEIDYTKAKNDYLSSLKEKYPDAIPQEQIHLLDTYGLEYKPQHKTLSIRYN